MEKPNEITQAFLIVQLAELNKKSLDEKKEF